MPTGHRVNTFHEPKPRIWVRPRDAYQGRIFRSWDGYEYETVEIPETRWAGKGSTLTQDESYLRGRRV
jgi:hypothetical protein